MQEVVIVSAARTPIGNFGGALSGLSAVELGVVAAKAALHRAGIDPALIGETFVGNILSAGLGQNLARQVAIKGSKLVMLPQTGHFLQFENYQRFNEEVISFLKPR